MSLNHAPCLVTSRAAKLLAVLLFFMLPAAGQAQFNYTVTSGAITITKYTGSGGAVTISNTMFVAGWGNLPVISIGNQAFSSCASVTNVTIGTNVTSIGSEAFVNCINLTRIAIPNSVTNVGDDAFGQCTSLINITISTNVTSIANYEFWDCTSLHDVAIPDGVTNIGYDAFFFCPNLASVTIPNSVTSIGEAAFSVSGLTSVTISENVTSIGNNAFGRCASLPAITADANNPVYSSLDGVLFNKDLTALVQYSEGEAGTSYTVPVSVASVGADAFAYCTNLTSVYFQGNAPNADSTAFTGDSLTIYYLPNATGWAATFANMPTWNPQAQITDASFGVRTNRFGFNITGNSNLVTVVEASANLINPVWFPIATNTLVNGVSYFSDSKWTNYSGRFYRLRAP